MSPDRGRPSLPSLVHGVHAVQELVAARPREVERIWVALEREASLGRLLRLARQSGVPVSRVGRAVLQRRLGGRAAHQGVAAQLAAVGYATPEELIAAAERGRGWLVLADGVVDPGNLGAILRTSAAAGVDGVILGPGTVGLTPAVFKVSAGTAARIPVARDSRLPRRLRQLAGKGFRALALDPREGSDWDGTPLDGRIVFVAGSEERGPRPGVLRECAGRLRIPLEAEVDSLNVGVALGVLLFEAVRQRRSSAGRRERWP